MTNPLLSVCVITYNHKDYIRECLDSILDQKTDFSYEIIIADDFSTDNTRAIIEEFKDKYTEVIKLIFQPKNVGGHQNFFDLMTSPKGKYVAYIEGDDYWTDVTKLQQQVDFLEQNDDYAICGHWTRNIDSKGLPLLIPFFTGQKCPESFTIPDCIKGVVLHPNTWVYRNFAINFPPILSSLPAGDDPFLLMILNNGKGYCIRKTMSIYRIHSAGAWSKKSAQQQSLDQLNCMYNVPKFVKSGYEDDIEKALKEIREWLIYESIHNYSFRSTISILIKNIRSNLTPKTKAFKLVIQYVFTWFRFNIKQLIKS